MDFLRKWSNKTGLAIDCLLQWLGLSAGKYYDWRERYGKTNQHNGWVPRDFWLEEWEKQAIIGFHLKNPLEGHRRLTFMTLDGDIVAVSPIARTLACLEAICGQFYLAVLVAGLVSVRIGQLSSTTKREDC